MSFGIDGAEGMGTWDTSWVGCYLCLTELCQGTGITHDEPMRWATDFLRSTDTEARQVTPGATVPPLSQEDTEVLHIEITPSIQ